MECAGTRTSILVQRGGSKSICNPFENRRFIILHPAYIQFSEVLNICDSCSLKRFSIACTFSPILAELFWSRRGVQEADLFSHACFHPFLKNYLWNIPCWIAEDSCVKRIQAYSKNFFFGPGHSPRLWSGVIDFCWVESDFNPVLIRRPCQIPFRANRVPINKIFGMRGGFFLRFLYPQKK